MITEYGSVLTDKTTVGEARKVRTKLIWLWVTLFVVGLMCLISNIIVGAVWETVFGCKAEWADHLFVSAITMITGLIIALFTRSRAKADLMKTDNIETNCELFSDCIIFREFKGDEQLGVFRINYIQILAVKQRENFIYCTIAQGIAYPVFLGGISETEINTIKKQLNLPISSTAETLKLKQCELLN